MVFLWEAERWKNVKTRTIRLWLDLTFGAAWKLGYFPLLGLRAKPCDFGFVISLIEVGKTAVLTVP